MTLHFETQRPLAADRILAVAVYVLYGVGYFTGVTAMMGVIIAHVKVDDTDPMMRSHFQFQIRTFWIGLLYLVTGFLLCFILIGFLVLVWWFVWSMVRIVKGTISAGEEKPIANPQSWLFG